jgi:hypothetical protein
MIEEKYRDELIKRKKLKQTKQKRKNRKNGGQNIYIYVELIFSLNITLFSYYCF